MTKELTHKRLTTALLSTNHRLFCLLLQGRYLKMQIRPCFPSVYYSSNDSLDKDRILSMRRMVMHLLSVIVYQPPSELIQQLLWLLRTSRAPYSSLKPVFSSAVPQTDMYPTLQMSPYSSPLQGCCSCTLSWVRTLYYTLVSYLCLPALCSKCNSAVTLPITTFMCALQLVLTPHEDNDHHRLDLHYDCTKVSSS